MPTPSAAPPPWQHCTDGASASDPVGCRGVRVLGHTRCLAHLPAVEQARYIASLAPGSDLDLRGTRITPTLLDAICTALRDPASGHARFGNAWFTSATFPQGAVFTSATFAKDALFISATFTGDAWFTSTTFTGDARFDSAKFTGDALFTSATFTGDALFDSAAFTMGAWFDSAAFDGGAFFGSAGFDGTALFTSATFTGDALFSRATFTKETWFTSTTFDGNVRFTSTTFKRDARFDAAAFAGNARFTSTTFEKNAWFDSATFGGLKHLGPMRCYRLLGFDEARFTGPVTLEAAAASVSLRRIEFAGSASFRLRYSSVSFSGAILSAPVALQSWPAPFATPGGPLDESQLASTGGTAEVRLLDLEGVDAAHLVLTDVALRECRFDGAFHLDQIQVGFGCRFAEAPPGWRRRWGPVPLRWSRRKVIAEEHHWRALGTSTLAQGWTTGPVHPRAELTPGPDDLAGIYQRLRKAFEDAGDEPGAADFYYGEMEMRRNDPLRPRAERWLLWWYWLLSGYGLRASRALSWLLAAMATTVLVLLLVGLPNADPSPQISGTDHSGQVQLTTNTPDPVLTLPLGRRFTSARTEKATLVVVNSVVFRSSGQNLTGWGTVVEMLSRIGEPVLLGLAALAVRGRVKR
ncbi:pentapeptide repeat-containing protein [Streptacidiphilus sp. PAMC 29251]